MIPAIFLVLTLTLPGCVRPEQQSREDEIAGQGVSVIGLDNRGSAAAPQDEITTDVNNEEEIAVHTVLLGETLSTIAQQYGTTAQALISLNSIEDASYLLPGQILRIPSADTAPPDTAAAVVNARLNVISNHDFVYGPALADFDLRSFLQDYDGYLSQYEEEVEGQTLDGAGVIQLVADRHSVSPKLLTAVLEYNAGWLTEATAADLDYMLGYEREGQEGLYRQLSWAANQLNWGFYGRSDGGLFSFPLGESEQLFAQEISDGTAGIQTYLAARDDMTYERWLVDAGPDGFSATYRDLFGLPADSRAPLLPDSLEQPPLELPWEKGETWNFSGGPHGGWNSGSAWAALDFVPPDVEYGCAPSISWITAVADGVVTRSGFGAVVLDLDNDGYSGTGWAVIYMHLDSEQRVAAGTRLRAGDRIGHPGCEGGFANGTHLHLARTYNGRWISADGDIPFNLSGWVSGGQGYEYNGWLARDGEIKTADVYASDDNAITAD